MTNPQPFFLGQAAGRRLACLYPPSGAARGALLYLHPFAEEMNKSRAAVARCARAFAAQGVAVLTLDLYGCGDSAGDFGDAGWQDWLADAACGADWLVARFDAPLGLWGLRSGALLAAEVAAARSDVAAFLAWQPVLQGAVFAKQFLRLLLAADLLAGGLNLRPEAAREALLRGEAIEVAGYRIAAALYRGLEAARFVLPTAARSVVLEVSAREHPALSPALAALLAVAEAASCRGEALTGPAFWMSGEIEDPVQLHAASLRHVEFLFPGAKP